MNTGQARQDAIERIKRLPDERLRVASEFLAYLEEQEHDKATAELLAIPGFDAAFRRASRQLKRGQSVPWDKVRRDV